MASTFATDFAAGPALRLFERFGESITITPSGGSPVSATGIVNRDPLQGVGPDGTVAIDYPLSVWVKRTDLSTVTVNADTIAVAAKENGSAVTYTVKALLEQTGGLWHLKLK